MKQPIKIAAFLGLIVTLVLVVVQSYRHYNTPERISTRAIESLGGQVTRFFGRGRIDRNAVCVSIHVDLSQDQLSEIGIHLRKLRSVEAIELTGTAFNDAFLENCLAHVPNLQQLRLVETNFSGQGLASLKNPNHLSELSIYGHSVTLAGLQTISKLENLKSLAIFSDGIGLGKLTELAKLESLEIIFTQTPSTEIDTLSKLTNLQYLRLNGPITNSSIRFVSELPNLECLDAASTDLDDSALVHLCNPPKIRSLRLGGTKITGIGFGKCNQTGSLKYLDLQDTMVDDDGMVAIVAIDSLERLDLSNTEITDEGIHELNTLKDLEYLHIQDTNVSDKSASAIRGIPNLVYLDIQGTKLSKSGIKRIKQNPKLESLNHHNIRRSD